MIKDETENPRHLPRVSMRGTWYFSSVIRVRLELTANGLKDHCYDVLIPDITVHTVMKITGFYSIILI